MMMVVAQTGNDKVPERTIRENDWLVSWTNFLHQLRHHRRYHHHCHRHRPHHLTRFVIRFLRHRHLELYISQR